MKQIDGNIWLTAKIMDRIRELDIILEMLEARVSRYGTGSAMLNGTIKLTRSTHQVNVDILRKINPEYYRISKSTLIRQ